MTIDIIKIEINNILRDVFDGNDKALNTLLKLRDLEQYVKDSIEAIKPNAENELYDYPKQVADINGFKISMTSRTNYSYSSPAYDSAKARLKAIEQISKNLQLDSDAFDSDGNQILPATKTTTNFIKIEVQR